MKFRAGIAGLFISMMIAACSQSEQTPSTKVSGSEDAAIAAVNAERLVNADREPGAWMSHGRTYDEQRFSPLDKINDGNVAKLGLAWTYKLDIDRGIEATPIVVDGVMYTTGAYSMVYALDPVSGERLWKYDPQVDRSIAGKACCGVVNRGVAVWNGKVYVGAFDGRLIALDASTGKPEWSVDTLIDGERNYTITGAPRVIKGKVIIGNGGAELGVRGYITAYDAETGAQAWRFFTVPGDPAKPAEDKAMEMARATWFGDNYWKQGGGGTVWDSMAYDPELDLLYIGTGNGSPWNIRFRSDGKGDNLFLSSIVALRPETGEYVWHYQTTPGDTWDYTATQHIILADMKIAGADRKVLMQAPKNGFFYVLDRATGELLSAEKFVPINWASHVDMETGRPVVTETGDYSDKAEVIIPGPQGAHNWHPMSYSPKTGLVYIPAQHNVMQYEDSDAPPVMGLNLWNLGIKEPAITEDADELRELGRALSGSLIAWDPVSQKAAWTHQYPHMWNSGLLSTAGNLVFQGNTQGQVQAFAADSGKVLWTAPSQTGVVAAPITYQINGEQYVSFMAGWGGSYPLNLAANVQAEVTPTHARVLTYKLGGSSELPADQTPSASVQKAPELTGTPEQVAAGAEIYGTHCWQCHGFNAVGNAVTQDLRLLNEIQHRNFAAIVKGASKPRGMPSFAHVLDDVEIDALHQYLISQSHKLSKDAN